MLLQRTPPYLVVARIIREGTIASWLAISAAALIAVGCSGSSKGEPDQALGTLVQSAPEPRPIDLDRAASDPDELLYAARMSHALVGDALGSHGFASKATIEVREGDTTVDTLVVDTTMSHDSGGGFRAVQNNSKDYGREVVYVGDYLYLAPRYGKFHRRRPEAADEPAAIRDQMFGDLAANLELLLSGVVVDTKGEVQHGGRTARLMVISAASQLGQPATESKPQRAWRESVAVADASGEIVLDAESGAPLRATLSGRVDVVREGRQLTMVLAVEHEITDIGQAVAIAAPEPDNWVDTPLASIEVKERNALLKGIAPPIRKSAKKGSGK